MRLRLTWFCFFAGQTPAVTLTSQFQYGDDYYTNDVMQIACTAGARSSGLLLHEHMDAVTNVAGCAPGLGEIGFVTGGIFSSSYSPKYITIRPEVPPKTTDFTSYCQANGTRRIDLELSITDRRTAPPFLKFYCGAIINGNAEYSTEAIEITNLKRMCLFI